MRNFGGPESWPNHMSSVRPRRWFARLFAKKEEQEGPSPYHSVAIHCTNNSCPAALESQFQRHLSSDAPMLPLAQCDRPDQCECRYQHYEDRRGDSRRASDQGLSRQKDSNSEERRSLKSRRAEDFPEDEQPFSVHEDSYYEHVGDTIRTTAIELNESDGVDPYNSGSFDKSKSWKSSSR